MLARLEQLGRFLQRRGGGLVSPFAGAPFSCAQIARVRRRRLGLRRNRARGSRASGNRTGRRGGFRLESRLYLGQRDHAVAVAVALLKERRWRQFIGRDFAVAVLVELLEALFERLHRGA